MREQNKRKYPEENSQKEKRRSAELGCSETS